MIYLYSVIIYEIILIFRILMNTISALLSEYRKRQNLTQQGLVDELVRYSDDFKALNTVTLSRWETGVTTPSLKKKKLLLSFITAIRYLEDDTCYDIVKERYENLDEPLSGIFTRNYQYLIGNLPEQKIEEYTIHSLNNYAYAHEYLEHIIDIETASQAEGYYTVTPEVLEEWCSHPASFSIICERKRQHLGHFIMFKLKNSVARDIAHNRRNKHSLTKDDFCDVHENGTYQVHAMYGRSPKIAAVLNVKAYLHLFEYMERVDNVMIFSTRKDGVLLTKDYGIEMVAKGKDEQYGFNWHGMLSPVEDILFSDTVLKLIL